MSEFVGPNETPTESADIIFCENALSVTVGMVAEVSGDKVPRVKSTGPILNLEMRKDGE